MKKFYCLENGITFCESNSYIHFLMVCVCWKKKFFFFALKINTRQNDGGGTHFYFISGNIFPISIFFGSRFFFLNTLLRIKYLKDLVVAVVEWFRLLHRWKKNVNIPPYKMNLNTEKKFEKNWKIISSLILLAIFFRGLISVLYSQFDNEVFHHYPEFIFISVVHFFFLVYGFLLSLYFAIRKMAMAMVILILDLCVCVFQIQILVCIWHNKFFFYKKKSG